MCGITDLDEKQDVISRCTFLLNYVTEKLREVLFRSMGQDELEAQGSTTVAV